MFVPVVQCYLLLLSRDWVSSSKMNIPSVALFTVIWGSLLSPSPAFTAKHG